MSGGLGVEPISAETVEAIHDMQLSRHGGMPGVRDRRLLEACVAQPWQSFGGSDLYPTLQEKAARLCYEVVTQHPFADGNKRTGAAAMLALLRANGARFRPGHSDFLSTVVGVASGEVGYDGLLDFVRRSC